MSRTTLVIGGSGFLGSHVVRQLVARGDSVRVWLRPTSSTRALEDLDLEIVRGELDDAAALRGAMAGVDAVHYCVVDTRAWLRDPSPLFATNVGALRGVLDVAVETAVPRFVFCSTVGTVGLARSGPAHEETPHAWRHLGGPYIDSRIQAEQLVLEAARDRGLGAVVLNVSTTYGPRDHGPTPHGKLVRAASRGKVAAFVRGASMEVVGIEDAARAFLLAEQEGRVGERYIISEQFLTIQRLLEIAADEGGVAPPRLGIPIPAMAVVGAVSGAISGLRRKDSILTPTSVRLMHIQSPLDHSKATRELGWVPGPTEESIRAGVRWFQENRSR